MLSMPRGERVSRACMHVSILSGLLLTSSAYREHKEDVVAPCRQLFRVGVLERFSPAPPKERGICQRCKLFARDLQNGDRD